MLKAEEIEDGKGCKITIKGDNVDILWEFMHLVSGLLATTGVNKKALKYAFRKGIKKYQYLIFSYNKQRKNWRNKNA